MRTPVSFKAGVLCLLKIMPCGEHNRYFGIVSIKLRGHCKRGDRSFLNYPAVVGGKASADSSPVYGSVTFTLDHGGGNAGLSVFDLSGRVVSVVSSGFLSRWECSFAWNADDLAPGVDIARFEGSGITYDVRLSVL